MVGPINIETIDIRNTTYVQYMYINYKYKTYYQNALNNQVDYYAYDSRDLWKQHKELWSEWNAEELLTYYKRKEKDG